MTKKNKQSFASRAKSLIAKYSRAKFDSSEKAELDSALKSLSQEQEAYRNANGMNQEQQAQPPMGQPMQQFGGGSFLNPTYAQGTLNAANAQRWGNQVPQPMQSLGNQPVVPSSNLIADSTTLAQPTQQQFSTDPYQTSIVPSLVSGGISTLGNMYLANQAGKNVPELNLDRATAQHRSLAKERESAARQARTAQANTRRNIKSGSKNRGELMSNVVASEAAMQENLADAFGQSYQREEGINANERARVQAMNAQTSNQEAQYNATMQNQANREKQAYQSAAIQGIPQTMKDVTAIQQQDAMINSLGEDYGIFQQDYAGRKWYQPKKTVRKPKKK